MVATAGTTLTGAVDPLDAIADACAEHGVWLHVDGAYGLPAAAVAAQALFAGLERADSVTLDAHKWLGVQKSCSAVLLREAGALRAAYGHDERYMLHEGDQANPVDRTLEYSRPLRSLRLWLALRVHGAAQYREWIAHTLGLAARLAEQIRASDDFELLHEPQLSTLCFRHLGSDNVALAERHPARRPRLPRPRDGRRRGLPAGHARQLPDHRGPGRHRPAGGPRGGFPPLNLGRVDNPAAGPGGEALGMKKTALTPADLRTIGKWGRPVRAYPKWRDPAAEASRAARA